MVDDLLQPPVRPNYFTGRLLTAEDLEQEQTYHLEKERRHNRFLHGWGVAYGLEVEPADGGAGVVVHPGLAIDGLGRELVVPRAHRLADPRQPTDDRGAPCGDRVGTDVLTLCLEYAEFGENPVPTEDGGQEPAQVREGYCLLPLPGDRHRPEPVIGPEDCKALRAASKHERRQLLARMLGRTAHAAGAPAVPLAVLGWAGGAKQPTIEWVAVPLGTARGVFELLLCLIEGTG
jgi:hypothetical protein